MLDNFQGITNGNDTGKTPLQDMLAAVELWCKDIETRLQDYLKRRNIRWQRLGNYYDDDINNLSHYMEYNDNYDDK